MIGRQLACSELKRITNENGTFSLKKFEAEYNCCIKFELSKSLSYKLLQLNSIQFYKNRYEDADI